MFDECQWVIQEAVGVSQLSFLAKLDRVQQCLGDEYELIDTPLWEGNDTE